jgi:flagellar M-ring protein FliF
MLDGLSQIGPQLAAFWRGLSAAQRLAFLSVTLITLGAGALLVRVASEPDYATLFAGLAPEDAATIVDTLRASDVPFRLEHAGTAVLVPRDRVYDLRLDLASKGLPSSGPIGFEVFDDASLGMTPFQQQVHYRRALEGELERTISRLRPVHWARVHINIPERTAFRRDRKEPTAAVVLNLGAGQKLSAGEAMGITQLIAGAVEGLDPGAVTLVDARGQLLVTPGRERDSTMAAGVLELQKTIEESLEVRAQALLDAALGPGRSAVTVAAKIDRRRFEEKQERVNPDESAVISNQTTEESRTTPASAFGGIPGTPSNLPGGTPPEVAAQNGTETITRETQNFDVSRSQSTTVVPMGQIERLSIAVLLDGTYAPAVTDEETADAAPAAPAYTPRTDEEILLYTNLVKRAVGFDDARGDTIEVQNVAFRSPLAEVALEAPPFWDAPLVHVLAPTLARVGLVLLGLLLLIRMVLRPTLATLAQAAATSANAPIERGAAGSDGPLLLPSKDAELVIPLGKDQAKNVAEAMRQWLRE